jgi:glycosyltransferase involved in cell wall biosynthesis
MDKIEDNMMVLSVTPQPDIFDEHPHLHLPACVALKGKRAAMVVFSSFPDDPRPRRAAEALISVGMSVDMICLQDKDKPKRESFNGIRVRRISVARRRGGTLDYIYQYVAFLLIASGIITKRSLSKRYDLVYVHNMPDFLVLSGLIPKIFGAKIVLDLHDPMPELMMTINSLAEQSMKVSVMKREEKWSMYLADAVITVNQACARLFASRSCKSEKITVVMNSPDEKIFRLQRPQPHNKTNRKDEPFVIMYHGSLVERNGLELAVDAFEKIWVSIPTAEMRIYGFPNSFLDRVMESVQRRGLEKSVRYYGPKPIEQIVHAIEDCDVGIIPNQRNIFTELNTPTRIFEYLALGKPVITPRAPGISDYFDENTLVYFELGSAEDLAKKIEFVFKNPELAVEMTRRGQKVHQAHTWRIERTQLIGLMNVLWPDGSGRSGAKHP